MSNGYTSFHIFIMIYHWNKKKSFPLWFSFFQANKCVFCFYEFRFFTLEIWREKMENCEKFDQWLLLCNTWLYFYDSQTNISNKNDFAYATKFTTHLTNLLIDSVGPLKFFSCCLYSDALLFQKFWNLYKKSKTSPNMSILILYPMGNSPFFNLNKPIIGNIDWLCSSLLSLFYLVFHSQ